MTRTWSPELRTLLSQLGGALEIPGPPPAEDETIDWGKWWALVQEHQLGPLLGAHLDEAELPSGAHAELVAQLVRNGHEMSFRATELSRFSQRLEGRASFVVLKGGALAFTRYESAAERVLSDFDLLFDTPEALELAQTILSSDGYHPSGRDRPGHHHVAPLRHDVRGTIFELHSNLMTPPLPERAIAEIFARKRRMRGDRLSALHVMDAACQIVHHGIHALADPIDSALLRNLAELAMLCSHADDETRTTAAELAIDWGVGDLAREASDLAHRLFGSPRLLGASSPSWRQRWAEIRLAWADTWVLERPWADRFVRHVANEHIAAINRGSAATSLRALAHVAWLSARSSGRSFVDGRRPGPWLARREGLRAGWVEDSLLVHDTGSGAVHLLDPMTGRVFDATDAPISPEALTARCGFDRPQVDASTDALVERGLLERCRSTAGE